MSFPARAADRSSVDESETGVEQDEEELARQHAKWERKHGPHGAKLTLLPLIAIVYFEVSAGPFGVEDAVRYGGPLLAILGFAFFPLVWCVPEAYITAELSTAFPENGGYVIWVAAAFGPFWGFQEGWWKWLSGVIDNSLYPILFLDYLKRELPCFEDGLPRATALILMTLLLTYLNYRGLTIVGYTAIVLTVLGLLPFLVLSAMALPMIQPRRWLRVNLRTVDWRRYLNTLFWNLNYWDSVSTLAGEVAEPQRTFPAAMNGALVLVILGYLLPLMAGTGALPFDESGWDDGYLAVVARKIGGGWLAWWVAAAAALSNMGAFEAEMSSDAFQLLGMAERGFLPEAFTYRSKHGTPLLGILASASGVILLSWMTFQEIVDFLNFLYCLGMLLEFAAFVTLRFTDPDLPRPYRVPVNNAGAILICLLPSILLLVVMALAATKTMVVSFIAALIGFAAYPLLMWARDSGSLKFSPDPGLPEVPLIDDELDVDASEREGEGEGQGEEEREGEEGGEVSDGSRDAKIEWEEGDWQKLQVKAGLSEVLAGDAEKSKLLENGVHTSNGDGTAVGQQGLTGEIETKSESMPLLGSTS